MDKYNQVGETIYGQATLSSTAMSAHRDNDPLRPSPPSPVAPLAPLDFLQSHRRGSITDPALHAAPADSSADPAPLSSDASAQLRRLLRSPSPDTQSSDTADRLYHRAQGMSSSLPSAPHRPYSLPSQAQTIRIGASITPATAAPANSSTTTCADTRLLPARKRIHHLSPMAPSARCLRIAMALPQLARTLIPNSSAPACQAAWKSTQTPLRLSVAARPSTPGAWHSLPSTKNATSHGGPMEGVNFQAPRL